MLNPTLKALVMRNPHKYYRLLTPYLKQSNSLNLISTIGNRHLSQGVKEEKTTGWDKANYDYQRKFNLYDSTVEDEKIELRRRKGLVKLITLGLFYGVTGLGIPFLFMAIHCIFI